MFENLSILKSPESKNPQKTTLEKVFFGWSTPPPVETFWGPIFLSNLFRREKEKGMLLSKTSHQIVTRTMNLHFGHVMPTKQSGLLAHRVWLVPLAPRI